MCGPSSERQAWRPAPSHNHHQQVASSRRHSRCHAAAAARPPPPPLAAAAATPPAEAEQRPCPAPQPEQQLLCPALLALLERGCAASSSLSADQASRQQQERLVNQGAAIRALQRDLPALLEREPEDMSIYCEASPCVCCVC